MLLLLPSPRPNKTHSPSTDLLLFRHLPPRRPILRRLKQHPLTPDPALALELLHNDPGNGLEITTSQRQNRRPGATEADPQQSRVRAWRHARQDLRQGRDQRAAVGLVNPVLHGLVDEIGVGRVVAERRREQRDALQVEDHVGAGVGGGEDGAGLGSRDFEVRDHGDAFDAARPGEFAVVSDVEGWGWRGEARFDAAGWRGEDFGEGDLDPGLELWGEGREVGPDEAAVEGGGDVVRVALDH